MAAWYVKSEHVKLMSDEFISTIFKGRFFWIIHHCYNFEDIDFYYSAKCSEENFLSSSANTICHFSLSSTAVLTVDVTIWNIFCWHCDTKYNKKWIRSKTTTKRHITTLKWHDVLALLDRQFSSAHFALY